MIISQNKGPRYRPQYTMILIMVGTPKKVPLILGSSAERSPGSVQPTRGEGSHGEHVPEAGDQEDLKSSGSRNMGLGQPIYT